MKKSRIALSVILGSVVLVSAVAVSIFVVANDTAASSSAQTADVAKMSPASLNENAALPVQSRGVIDTIKKTSYEPDRIDLSWDAADDADGYSVYICDRDSSRTTSRQRTSPSQRFLSVSSRAAPSTGSRSFPTP